MLSRKKMSRFCLNQMLLLLILESALCELAFIGVKLEPTNIGIPIFTFNETAYTNFYKCLVTRYDNCLIKYELSVNNVTGIVESGSSNISALPVYTCKNNQSTSSICCSREDQCNCTFTSYDFAVVWNYVGEYFYHPYLNNRTITCVNRNYTFYFNKSDVSTTTQRTNVHVTPSNPPNTTSNILKSTFSTTTNNASNFESEDNKLPIVLGIIGGIACLALIIAAAVFVIRRVRKNQTLLASSPIANNLSTNRTPNIDRAPTNYNFGDKSSIKSNDYPIVSPNVCTQSDNDEDSSDHGFKYFNTIVEDDYTCIDDNKRNTHRISTAAVSATIHPETSDVIDSLKTDYTDIKISKDNNDLISKNNTETRKTNHDDSYNFISDTKDDYSRLGQDIRDVKNPYDGLLELNQEQSNVHQHELSPYTLAKPISGAATLEVINIGVCHADLQPHTTSGKHSVNTEHQYNTSPNDDIKRNALGYTEVKKQFLK